MPLTLYLKLIIEKKKRVDTINKALTKKNEELIHTNKEKDRLFSILGHDLRSPLNSIQGFLEILTISDITEKERDELNAQLLELTNSTSTLLNNLLHWSARNHDKSVSLEKLNLEEVINDILPLLKTLAKQKDIQLNLLIPQQDLYVIAQKDMLQLVIRNLISNAIKFTHNDGHISLKIEGNQSHIHISVKDNGVGIPLKKQKEIFTTAASATTGTSQEKGIGLGLVLCHDFVESMEGTIAFTSTEGKGSEFTIRLKKG